ncbi:MAG: hypothetical protein MUC50_14745 [Myxococcota bacterium]|jgi:hypothetical protein|nr:hypothetical protein [Myxococcota bacterium]
MIEEIKSNPSRVRTMRLLVAGLAVAGAVFGVVFYFATRAPTPPMPRATITPQEEKADLERIKGSLKDLRTGKEIPAFLDQIEKLNLAELQAQNLDRAELEAVEKAARAMAHESPEGYRLLGAKLSLEFMELMNSLLDDAAAHGGIASALKMDETRAKRLERLGGSFLRRAMEKGIVESDGSLHASRLALQCMFHARWNHLAGLAPDDSLGPAARKVYFDWTARFSEPTNLNKRLSAIGMLRAADSTYDDVLAKAIVLYEGGRKDDALAVLKEAIEKGRKDEPTLDFARALTSN